MDVTYWGTMMIMIIAELLSVLNGYDDKRNDDSLRI